MNNIGGFEGGLEEAQQMQLNRQSMMMNNLTMQRAMIQNYMLNRQVQEQKMIAQAFGGDSNAAGGNAPAMGTPVPGAPGVSNINLLPGQPGTQPVAVPPQPVPAPQGQGGGNAPAQDPLGTLSTLAGVYAHTGDINGLNAIMNLQRQYQQTQSNIQKNTAQTQLANANSEIKAASLVGQYLGKAQSPQDWARGLAILESSGAIPPKEMALLKNTPYSPEVANRLWESSINAGAQARIALAKTMANFRVNQAAATNSFRKADLGIRKTEANAAKLRAERAGRNGVMHSPTDSDIALATDVGTKVFGKGMSQNLITDIAAKAQALQQRTPGLSSEAAMQKAALGIYQSGAYRKNNGLFGGDSWSRVQDGASADTAIPLPLDQATGKVNESDMKNGKYYLTQKGPARWDAKSKRLVF